MLHTRGRPSVDLQIQPLPFGPLSCKFWPPGLPKLLTLSSGREFSTQSGSWLSSGLGFLFLCYSLETLVWQKVRNGRVCVFSFLSATVFHCLQWFENYCFIYFVCSSVCHFGGFMEESISSSYCSLARSENPLFLQILSYPLLFVQNRLGTWLVHSLNAS